MKFSTGFESDSKLPESPDQEEPSILKRKALCLKTWEPFPEPVQKEAMGEAMAAPHELLTDRVERGGKETHCREDSGVVLHLQLHTAGCMGCTPLKSSMWESMVKALRFEATQATVRPCLETLKKHGST